MEFYFDAMFCSNLGKENSDVGHIKCSRRPRLTHGLQVHHPCSRHVQIAAEMRV